MCVVGEAAGLHLKQWQAFCRAVGAEGRLTSENRQRKQAMLKNMSPTSKLIQVGDSKHRYKFAFKSLLTRATGQLCSML